MASPPRSVERRYNRRTGALPGFSSAADQSHLSSASSTRQDSFKPSSDVGSWIHERRTLHALKLRRRRLVRTTEPNLLKALQTALLQAWYFGKGSGRLKPVCPKSIEALPRHMEAEEHVPGHIHPARGDARSRTAPQCTFTCNLTCHCQSSGVCCEEGCKKAGETVAAAEEENDAARRISPVRDSQAQQ